MPQDKYTVGDYWLDKRRDGKAADVWQITWYDAATRQIRYKSTRKRGLDDAKAVIHAHAERQRAKAKQEPDEARVIPLLFTYWDEKGRLAISPAQIASSLRAFIGFLMQDEVGMNAVLTDLTPVVFSRFRQWRMGPHEYDVPWGEKDFRHKSEGVKGETVQRNLDDVRAAINHAQDNGRIITVPKVPAVKKEFRSPPRDRVLTWRELGMIYWYARQVDALGGYVALMLGTAVRPLAASRFRPSQYDAERGLIDLHPAGKPRTDKRNPVVPAIRPLRLILARWEAAPAESRKKAWRTMRAALGLSEDVVAKTIRHTVATLLYSDPSVPRHQISDLLGHTDHLNRTSRVYAKYDPAHMREVTAALSRIWLRVAREANAFGADHILSIGSRKGVSRVDKTTVVSKDNQVFAGGGR